MTFAFESTSGQWARSAENWTSAFCEFQHHLFRHIPQFSLWTIFVESTIFFRTRTNEWPLTNLPIRETRMAFESHSCSLSFDALEMSLNIDMNRINPVKFSGVSPIFNSKHFTSWLSRNVMYSGDNFQSKSISSPSFLSKSLYSWDILNHPNYGSHAMSDWAFSCISPNKHNLKRRSLLCAEDWWLVHHQSKTNASMSNLPDLLFSLQRSYLVQTPISQISNICFIVRSCVFDGMPIIWVVLPMKTVDSNLHITKCFSSFSVTFFEDRLCFFALDHSPYPIKIWILTTIPILLRSLQWWIAVAFGCPRSIIHQFISFPLLRRPSFVIIPSWVACWVRVFKKLLVVVPWRVTCVTVDNGLPLLSSSSIFALQELWLPYIFSPGLCDAGDEKVEGAFAIKFIVGLDFDVTHSSLESGCNWNSWYWTNTKDDSIRHAWSFPWLACRLVGLWCRCSWFEFWGPNWFVRITSQEQLCGSWKHVSLWDPFL